MARSSLSAGLLMYRRNAREIEVFLVHPGGPFYRGKDHGVWSVPKGEYASTEDPLEVAHREFCEETGSSVDACAKGGERIDLDTVRLKSGKTVRAWAFEGDWPKDAEVTSNVFQLEWPPRSGRVAQFPEVDQGRFFPIEEARARMHPDQTAFLDRLLERLPQAG